MLLINHELFVFDKFTFVNVITRPNQPFSFKGSRFVTVDYDYNRCEA